MANISSKFKELIHDWTENGIMGFLLTALTIGGITLAYHIREPYRETKTHLDEFPLFNGAASLVKIEEDKEAFLPIMTNDKLISVRYEIRFNKPGNYLFEGWESDNKGPDFKVANWEYDIKNTPVTKNPEQKRLIDRLEATTCIDGKINRESIPLRRYRHD